MAKRYRLPEELGSAEMEAVGGDRDGNVTFLIDGHIVKVAPALLTELADPTPPEPQAEIILLEFPNREIVPRLVALKALGGWYFVGGNAADQGSGYSWERLWRRYPNAVVTRLVPALEPVSLPWIAECGADTGMVLEIREEDTDVHVPVIIRGSATVYLTREDVRDAARALLTAAGDLP